jgi:ABC-2 type transport system permease protein
MSGAPSRVAAIVRKDIRAFSRDRFYSFITILGLVIYVALYWVLPDTVDETIEIGLHAPGFEQLVPDEAASQGLAVVRFDSAEEVEAAVAGTGERPVAVGLSFPDDFLAAVAAGRPTTVRVFTTADLPPQVRTMMTGLVRELAYAVAGSAPPVNLPDQEEIVIGSDRAGQQVSMQQSMGPLLVFFVLMIETFALAGLVASEIQKRTVTAVMVTPVRMWEFLTAKSLFGMMLAFGQALLLAALIGMLGTGAVPLLIALLLGALLMTGVGLIAGSSGKDFLGILFYSMLFLVPLMVPAFSALFPGTAAWWVQLLPTHGLVEAILRSTAYGAGLGDILPHLLSVAAWCAVAFAVGLWALRRKVATL